MRAVGGGEGGAYFADATFEVRFAYVADRVQGTQQTLARNQIAETHLRHAYCNGLGPSFRDSFHTPG